MLPLPSSTNTVISTIMIVAGSQIFLFSPCTLIIDDSLIRCIAFLSIATHCFSSATAPNIIVNFKNYLCIRLLQSGVGANDTTKSEVIKPEFSSPVDYLKTAGPIPTLSCGCGYFSMILRLQPTCRAHKCVSLTVSICCRMAITSSEELDFMSREKIC